MSVQRFAMDPRSGKYAEPMDVALAVTILSEMADEWSWDDDPHGYCHTRRPIVALLNAHDDHERALAEAGNDGALAGYLLAARPRTLAADDPEPGVGSVVLDRHGDAWQRVKSGVFSWRRVGYSDLTRWSEIDGPLRLIHDGGAA